MEAEENGTRRAHGRGGMVASAHGRATEAGVEILRAGGNAVDAAAAVAATLNVVEPNASGIGGGGFLTVRGADGRTAVLDFRETAPASATREGLASPRAREERWSTEGGRAVCVPGWLAGIARALETWGSLPLSRIFEPAIRLAEEGFRIHPAQSRIIREESGKLLRHGGDPGRIPFLREGRPLAPGEICRQPALAETFRRIAREGTEVFYRGEIGRDLLRAVERAGGRMTASDLAGYRVAVRRPLEGTYRGFRILSAPPASSGGTHLVELLNLLEPFPLGEGDPNGPETLHLLAEALKLIYADRAAYMADSAFASPPLAGLTSKDYARVRGERIDPGRAALAVPPGEPGRFEERPGAPFRGGCAAERTSTSSFSAADARGNWVACTCTVNDFFGSGVFVPEWGIVLNDEADDFCCDDPGSVNAPEPGKRPLSSMSPTLVLDPAGRPVLSAGAAGGVRILSAMARILVNLLDFRMSLAEAIEAPRIAIGLSGDRAEPLELEEGIPPETAEALRARGHQVKVAGRSSLFGTAQGILLDPLSGELEGAADPRRLGTARGC